MLSISKLPVSAGKKTLKKDKHVNKLKLNYNESSTFATAIDSIIFKVYSQKAFKKENTAYFLVF